MLDVSRYDSGYANTCQLPEEDAFKTAGVAIPDDFDGSKKSFTLPPPSEKCSAIGVLLFGKIKTSMRGEHYESLQAIGSP